MFPSTVLFFWRKLMNLLKHLITKILQHRTDEWEVRWKGKWYFPWALVCSWNQNNLRETIAFIIFFRHGITSKEISGESEKVTKEMAAPWEETTLPTLLARYQLKNVFNGDEFGLLYEALPSKSLHFRRLRCLGAKHDKIWLTGMATSNALGENIPMFVIGKSTNPRCFKHVHNLPCRYRF